MKHFTIDLQYCTSVTITRELGGHANKENLTPEELFETIKNYVRCYSTHTEDHPEFTRLRERLGEEGYITIERKWWNGDRVVTPFQLNNTVFDLGDKFPSAAAIRYCLTH